MKQNHSKYLSVILLSLILSAGHTLRAQEDFPPPPDFGSDDNLDMDLPMDITEPKAGAVGRPAPQPKSNSASQKSAAAQPSSSRNSNKAAAADKGGNGVLSNSQREKFKKAGIEDITSENFPETIESFDFPNVEVADLIKTMSELTGKNFVIDPGVRGKITIIAPSKITVAEAYKAFLSALAINNFAVVPGNGFYKIKPVRKAQKDSIETYAGNYYPNDDQMITRIIHLKHISAEILQRDLRNIQSPDGDMVVYTPTNSVIITDWGSNIDRIMKILNQLDVPGFEEQLEVIHIRYAKAKDMADLIDKIINKGQKSASQGAAGTFAAGVPRFPRTNSGTSSQSGSSYFMAIPDDRTNSIIVVGNKSGILRVKKLIAQLDFKIRPEESGGVQVYYVKYGDAEKISQVLSGIAKEGTPKPQTSSPFGGAPTSSETQIFGGDVKIVADKSTNALIITASKQDYEVVLNLLRKIDIARDQVYVEGIIMEMAASDSNDWSTGVYKYPDGGYGKMGYNMGVDINSLLSPAGGTGAVLGFGSSQTVKVTDPATDKSITIPNLIGFINFIKKTQKANILSRPQIIAMDNQSAIIEVGDRVVTSVTKTAGTNGAGDTYTPNLEDATIKLEIKPIINPTSNSVKMEIKQTVKQITTAANVPKAVQDSTTPLATRRVETTIVVRDNDTAVLGGLMKDEDRETISKVPLLGDLPLLGWLFKARTVQKQKVNMLVFLTPKIIRSPNDNKKLLTEKIDQRIDYVKSQGGKDPFGQTIDEIHSRVSNSKAGSTDSRKTE